MRYGRVVAVIGSMLLCVGVFSVVTIVRCMQTNVPPIAPVYPGSVLVSNQSSGVGTSIRPRVTYNYTSVDAPQSVIAFYAARGVCREGIDPSSNDVCRGDARPQGEYFVYVDPRSHAQEGRTSYSLEIRWHGCDNEFQ